MKNRQELTAAQEALKAKNLPRCRSCRKPFDRKGTNALYCRACDPYRRTSNKPSTRHGDDAKLNAYFESVRLSDADYAEMWRDRRMVTYDAPAKIYAGRVK